MGELAHDKVTLKNRWGRLTFNPAIGNLRHLSFLMNGQVIEPLSTAPWVKDATVALGEDLSPMNRALSGDFFCAPFGKSDVEDAPAHGWSANSTWEILSRTSDRLHCVLGRPVMGATIEKQVRLAPDAPLLYQTHWIKGGAGGLPVAHHPMIKLAGTGRFSTSPKRRAITSPVPLEPDRNRLACGSETGDLEAFPGDQGDQVDLTRLPIAHRHEDFITLVEAEGAPLGWSAVVRDEENDIVFVLKDPRVLPVTMLWHSNGGRDYAPWNGRHRGVLGIEDGCAAGDGGHRAALLENPVSRMGVATALPLADRRTHRVAHVIGALARPDGWGRIAGIAQSGNALILTEAGGDTRTVPFEKNFFAGTEGI
ncbi:MAG: hypothetical protein GXP01_05995 [Alphaproteobacteria bacterium]|nr:hypothetical protein [Alphaproteobacteria bacterium]